MSHIPGASACAGVVTPEAPREANQASRRGLADPRRRAALGVTQIAMFMVLLDVSIVNVALPSIERGLAVAAATAQWLVSGYALTLGLALVPAGRLGDSLGRRSMFVVSLGAFVGTSALTGAAPNTRLLIAARLLQGVAGGMLLPQISGLIQELFDGAERGRAFGILGATIGLATATGPVIGGLILAVMGSPNAWRWVFFVNVPIGLVALVLATRLLPSRTGGGWHGTHLDLLGALLLGGGVFSLLIPLVDTGSGGLNPLWSLWGLAALLLALFCWWEVRTVRLGREPLVDPRLARTPGYPTGSGIGLLYFMGVTGVWLVLALFLQDGLGYSPLRSGLAVTPFALGVAVSALIAGRLVSRFGRWLTVCGLTATVVGLVATALVVRHPTGAAAWAMAAPLLLAGLGGGMVTSPNLTLTLQYVPVEMAGAAGGTVQTAQRVGAAIGTAALAGTFYEVLARTSSNYAAAVSGSLLAAAGLLLLALLTAIAEVTRRRRHRPARPAPHDWVEQALHHM